MSTPSTPSIIRTLVPLAVGQIVSLFASLGIEMGDDEQAAFTVILGFLVTAVYYLIVRFLEQKFPKLGALLGWAETPGVYAKHHEVIELDPLEVEEQYRKGKH